MQLFIFPVCNFFDLEVHPPEARFDTRDVLAQASITPTGKESKCSAYGQQYKCEVEKCHDKADHMNVPCMCPSMSAIASAVTNRAMRITARSTIHILPNKKQRTLLRIM